MLNKIAYKIALAGLLTSLSGTASALGDQWYLGIGGGVSQLKPDITDNSIDTSDENGQVSTFLIGTDFDNRSSGQFQLYSLGDARYEGAQGSAGYTAGDASLLYRFYDSRDGKPRGTLFGTSLYGRFGFGFMQRDSDLTLDTDTPVYFGAGAGIETYLSFNLAVRLEALYHDTDASSATLTLVSRFGGRRQTAPVTPPAPVRSTTEPAPGVDSDAATTSNTTKKDAIAIPADLTKAAGSASVPGSSEAPIELTPLPDLNDSDTAISHVPDQSVTPVPETPASIPMGTTTDSMPSTADHNDLSEVESTDNTVPDVEIMGSATENQSGPKLVPPLAKDSDADGITDELDRCPDSTTGYPVTPRGCPAFGGMRPGLNFEEGTAELLPTGIAVLDTLVKQLQDYPDTYIEVVAHTDNTGTQARQSELTRQRLRSIGIYLVRHGISQDRLLLRSFGGSRPNFDNTTAEGRRRNNRIEIFENP